MRTDRLIFAIIIFFRCLELHSALVLTDWGGDRNAANLDTKAANIRRLISDARGYVSS